MLEGDAAHRAASALRIALAGKPMQRFDATHLVGPVPRAGRIVERVETHHKRVEIAFDDNMILHTSLRMTGSWHLYRHGEQWRKPYQSMQVAIEVVDWVAVCFNAAVVETYRVPDKRRHPGMGRPGPDLCERGVDLDAVVNLLLSYENGAAPLGEVLLDQRVLRGLGNAYRSEVLWAMEISPFARIDSLTEADAVRLVNTAASMLQASMRLGDRPLPGGKQEAPVLAVYGRNGQRCGRCGQSIDCQQVGDQQRMLYWCRDCQQYLDPRRQSMPNDDTPMDPHPAAQAYLAGLPWNRDAG